MLMVTGNQVGARALIEEVLAADATQIDALKMRASWLIDEDNTREAIALLRTALEESPEDVEALTLMAQAHLRNGDRDLAGEFLALSVEAANTAPAESIRYADFLIGRGTVPRRRGGADPGAAAGAGRSVPPVQPRSALCADGGLAAHRTGRGDAAPSGYPREAPGPPMVCRSRAWRLRAGSMTRSPFSRGSPARTRVILRSSLR